MKKFFSSLFAFLLPLVVLGQLSTLSKLYPNADWNDLSTWPLTIEVEKKIYTRIISQNIGDISFPPIEGREPTEKESKRLEANPHGAYYMPVGEKRFFYFNIYGPRFMWNGRGDVSDASFSDGKGTIKSYDKNGDLFRVEAGNRNDVFSTIYYDRYGREALEFKMLDGVEEYFQYRKPCSKWQFEEMKRKILKHFDLYKPVDEYRP